MGVVRLISSFDAFNRLPREMTEMTATGGFFTMFSTAVISLLVFLEFSQLFVLETASTLAIDKNYESEMEIHFNITMLDLPCKYTTVDVVDTFGFEKLDVEGGISKTRLHHDLDKDVWFRSKDTREQVIKEEAGLDNEHYEEEIRSDLNLTKGVHAPDLTPELFEQMLKYFQIVLVNFYAPWCIWSKRLAPEFEKTAQAIDTRTWSRKDVHVKMIRVDCDAHKELCAKYRIRGYPTVQLFRNGELFPERYNDDRTQDAFIAYLDKQVKIYSMKLPNTFHDIGCEIAGMIRVNRCPGNFHIKAKSGGISIAPSMTNVSHIVNHLSFGKQLRPDLESKLPPKFQQSLHPMNSRSYITKELHLSPQHYIKVVPSSYRIGSGVFGADTAETYQMSSTNRIAQTAVEVAPEAKFKYNFSPVSVSVHHESMSLYHFVTRFFAVLGGTYTLIIVSKTNVQSFSNSIFAKKRTLG